MSNVVLRVESQVAAGIAGVRRFRQEVKDTQVTAVDLRETWKATSAEIAAQQRKQIALEKETADALRAQIAASREVAAAYARGSEERQLATKLEIDLQRKLQATLGETAAAATRAGRAGGAASAERAAGREARGVLAGSRALGGRAVAFGSTAFLGGVLAGAEVKEALGAVREVQQAQAQLANAIKNSGDASAAARKQILESVDATEELGFKGTDTRESLTRLVVATGSATKAAADEARAANIARARHIDLTAATQILARIEAGRASGLSRFGIQTKQVTDAEDQLKNAHIKVTDANRAAVIQLEHRAKAIDQAATRQKALAEIDKRFAGSAEANARTASGASERLAASWEKLQVAIGRGLLPQMTRLSNATADYIDKATKSGKLQRDVAEGAHAIGDAFRMMKTGVEAVDRVTGSFTNTLKLVFTWMAAGRIVALAAGFARPLLQAFTAIRTASMAAFPWATLIQLAIVAVVLIIQHWGKVKEWFGVFWDYMKKTGAAAWAALKDLADSAVYAILQAATAGIRGVLEVASHLPLVGGKARAALNSLNDYISKWKPDFGNVVTAFQNAGNQAGSAFKDAAQAAMSGVTGTGGVGAATGGSPNRAGTSGGRTENYVPTTGSAVQKGLVSTAQSALGNPYLYGGAPSLSSPTDCSGLMVAVFAQHGISLPRTSEEQFAQAPIKNARPLAPGDLVFAEGVHPGHVGLYIGGGNVLEDPHTGDHVKIVPLSGFGWNGESARWWGVKARKTPTAGKPADTSTAVDTSAFTDAISAARTAGGTAKGKGLTQAGLISIEGQIDAILKAVPKGQLDQIEKTAVAHIKAIRDSLHVGMPAAELAKDRVELAKWGKSLRDEIAKNAKDAKAAAARHKKELAAAAAEARKAWEAGWTADVSIISRRIGEQWTLVQRDFDRETEKHVTAMQRTFATTVRDFDRATQQQLTNMQRTFQKQMDAFDAETQRGLDALQVLQTPEEQALAAFEAQRAAAATADRLTELKKTLADAQTALAQAGNPLTGGGVVGNTALLTPNGWVYQTQTGDVQTQDGQSLDDLRKAVTDAQKALDDELADEHDAALKQAAEASRAAADAQTKAAQDAYQDQRNAQRQHLQDAEDAREQAYQDDRDAQRQHLQDVEDDLERHYEDTRAAQWQALQDSHDDQVTMFDADLKLWQTAIEGKKRTWAQFIAWLQANPLSKGLTGGDIVNPADTSIPVLTDPNADALGRYIQNTGGKALTSTGKIVAQAAGGIAWRPTYMRGEQGGEMVIPLTSQRGAEMMRQLVAAAVAAGAGGGGAGPSTVVYGTFLGATERQVGRALEGIVTPQQNRVVRYHAPF